MSTIYVGIESIKNAYRDMLQDKGYTAEALAVNMKSFQDPVFTGVEVHADEEPERQRINKAFEQIGIDLLAVDAELAAAANNYLDLMEQVNQSLERVDQIIELEKDRIEDINIIAGHFPEFVSIKTMTNSDFSGTCSALDEYTFVTKATDRENIILRVADVRGNGYEGNQYVYVNGKYQNSYLDTSDRTRMVDNPSSTYYEYSRLTVAEAIGDYPEYVNFDNEEAKCVVSVYSSNMFNTFRISSELENLWVTQISVSEDGGVTYQDTMDKPIQILNPEQKYEDFDYIYGSGHLCFPNTHYAKISFQSQGVTDDQLAYEKLIVVDPENVHAETVKLPTVKRHVIRINDILGLSNRYDDESYLVTPELMTNGQAKSIAVFANEYLPPLFPSDANQYYSNDYFTYIFTINGEDIEVVPVNGHRAGIKIIRYTGYSVIDNYTKHVNEPIKSAYLTIKIKTPNDSYSPMVSNIKICIGEAVPT